MRWKKKFEEEVRWSMFYDEAIKRLKHYVKFHVSLKTSLYPTAFDPYAVESAPEQKFNEVARVVADRNMSVQVPTK